MDYDKDYHDSLFNRLDMFVRNSENENRASNTLMPEQSSTDTHVLSISENSVLDFLYRAIEQTYLLIDNETFYICDLSQERNTLYNTLVFQINGAPHKVSRNLDAVINRYFNYICVDSKSMMQLGKSLGTLRHCPFVLGSLCFTPLHGASKKHVSWIALHNVQDITAHQKATHFKIDSRHEVLLNIRYKKALPLIDQPKILSECQQKMTSEWMTLMYQHSYHNGRPNVVTRCNTNSHFSKPLPLLSSWLNTQSFLQTRTILKDMLKESDPLLEYLPPEAESDNDDINDEE